jgi:beta-N-acetylhexosaminidase
MRKFKSKIILPTAILLLTSLSGILFYFPSIKERREETVYRNIENSSDQLEKEASEIQQKVKDYKEKCSTNPDFSCYQNELTSKEQFLNSLSVEEKIKQLIGPLYTPHVLKDKSINKDEYGFYALIKTTSYSSAVQIQNDITENIDTNQEIPPFIGLDAEGGVVNRLSWHKITHLSELTQTAETELCKEIESDINALKKSGFNWSLAPVVDKPYSSKDWIYPRAVSLNQTEIINTAEKYIDCMNEEMILTTLKHFPGHGDSRVDSHKSIPVIDHKKDHWDHNEGEVFRELIEKGKAETVLIGHLRYPLISQEISSISNRWQQDILKDELGFDGLIISDDFFMLDDSVKQPCEKLSWEAVEAGTHVILFVENSKCSGDEIVKYFTEQYEKSDTNKQIIDDRVGDVLEFKKEWFGDF